MIGNVNEGLGNLGRTYKRFACTSQPSHLMVRLSYSNLPK
ncbi:hypothetical protein VSP9026_04343 [Vibrio spartinae]|uniref:Uncharacterized protein n=1 Tax=Vibrio spartinae TaxID=1918945 RepID=A0A1N6MB18_9VIBR|nr:hypothetical protein VSP9026_04343 [Vibrio spartinae]